MEKKPGLTILSDPKQIDNNFINSLFNQATEFVQQQVSNIWELRWQTG